MDALTANCSVNKKFINHPAHKSPYTKISIENCSSSRVDIINVIYSVIITCIIEADTFIIEK